VGQNARTVLTAGEQQLGMQTPDDHTTGAQWQQIFGGMDRRSMYAVANNQGGQFSVPEQQAAQTLMNQQVSDLVGDVGAMTNKTDQMNAFGSLIQFLNNVSPEEKASSGWALGMASAKTSYNDEAANRSRPTMAPSPREGADGGDESRTVRRVDRQNHRHADKPSRPSVTALGQGFRDPNPGGLHRDHSSRECNKYYGLAMVAGYPGACSTPS
jgi:hypothetical protein